MKHSVSITIHNLDDGTYYALIYCRHGDKYNMQHLTHEHACELMWKVVRAGGKRSYRMNLFNSSMSIVRTTLEW